MLIKKENIKLLAKKYNVNTELIGINILHKGIKVELIKKQMLQMII